jgi:hypothetical protein
MVRTPYETSRVRWWFESRVPQVVEDPWEVRAFGKLLETGVLRPAGCEAAGSRRMSLRQCARWPLQGVVAHLNRRGPFSLASVEGVG